jgi:hypothetical protein
VDEKTYKEEPNKAHDVPKPIWTGQVTERKEQERKQHSHRPGLIQEAVEFLAHLPPRWTDLYRPSKHECYEYPDDHQKG